MSRLLFCWELGANFGHLAAISVLRQRLRGDGHELFFAVADLRAARELLGEDAAILQAPVWPRFTPRGSRNEVASFADVLGPLGFADPSILAPMVDGWIGLIRVVGPDVIIADHSPAAQLGARLARLPLITMGTGFTQPPLDYQAFPPLRADIAPALPEAILLSGANEVLARRGAAQLYGSLPDLFRADSRVVIGLPELDPYRSFRRELLCAPPGGYLAPAEPEMTSACRTYSPTSVRNCRDWNPSYKCCAIYPIRWRYISGVATRSCSSLLVSGARSATGGRQTCAKRWHGSPTWFRRAERCSPLRSWRPVCPI